MNRTAIRLAVVLALAAASAAALAQAPSPSPYAPPQTGPGTASAMPPAGAARPRFYLGLGYDIGGAQIAPVTLSDGTSPSLRYNAGLFLAGGGDFLHVADGLLNTRATVGVRYRMINAADGDITHVTFPLEVVEMVNLLPVRLGAGLSAALGPRVTTSGAGDQFRALGYVRDMKTTVGFTAQGEYQFGGQGGGAAFVLGLRYLVQKVKFAEGGTADGNSLGIYIAYLP